MNDTTNKLVWDYLRYNPDIIKYLAKHILYVNENKFKKE